MKNVKTNKKSRPVLFLIIAVSFINLILFAGCAKKGEKLPFILGMTNVHPNQAETFSSGNNNPDSSDISSIPGIPGVSSIPHISEVNRNAAKNKKNEDSNSEVKVDLTSKNFGALDPETFLKRFHKNTLTVIDEIPIKRNRYGKLVPLNIHGLGLGGDLLHVNSSSSGHAKIIGENDLKMMEEIKDRFRTKLIAKRSNLHRSFNVTPASISNKFKILASKKLGFNKALILNNDLAEDLLENGEHLIRNIHAIDAAKLTKGKVKVQPWSDDYWPIYKGVLAFRYADKKMNKDDENDSERKKETSWLKYNNYQQKNPMEKFITEKKSNLLSPAEKYDLLVGNQPSYVLNRINSLTDNMWEMGREYFEEQTPGKVETWMGICDGWASASYMFKRPIHAVKVKSPEGEEIKFYPADLKALASLYWSQLDYPQRSVGGRCDTKKKKLEKDEESGRVIDPDCFDTNPGSWHMAVVNIVGNMQRPFVIDSAFDYEVWNQPVVSYEYTYFNPQTFSKHRKAEDAIISLSDYHKDKFKKFRAPNAKKIVGVLMRLSYLSETYPSQTEKDVPSNDEITVVDYHYDLELDDNDNIIGGEWYTNQHPDFMWTPVLKASHLTSYDKRIRSKWFGNKKSLSKDWLEPAQSASIETSMPLGKILDELFRRSRSNEGSSEDENEDENDE